MTCPRCKTEYENAKFCPECGLAATQVCAQCGTKHSAKYCPECGQKAFDVEPAEKEPSIAKDPPIIVVTGPEKDETPKAPEQPIIIINNANGADGPTARGGQRPQPKNKLVALILCLFLGVVGGHMFYAGKIAMGVIYIFTGGLFGIGWIVDIIRIATGSFKDYWGFPLENN